MDLIETKEGYLAKITNSIAEIYTKSGICLSSTAKVIYLQNRYHKFEVNFIDNYLILGNKGLLGGGNCASSSGEKNPKKRKTVARLEERKTRGMFISPIELFMSKDDLMENKLKKLLNIFMEKLKIGEFMHSIIKEIDEQAISSTFNFFSIFEEIIAILSIPELYCNKNGVFSRYKLSVQARKFLSLYLIIKQENLQNSTISSLKTKIERIKHMISDDFFIELGFQLNLTLINCLLDNINIPIHEKLKPILELLVSNFYKETFNEEIAIEYLNTSVKYQRDMSTDLILLTLLDTTKCFKILNHMIDLSFSLSWENIGVILSCFSYENKEAMLLAEYLYFSNYETKEVWKIRCLALELLCHHSIMNPSKSEIISMVIYDKKKQADEPRIEKLLKYSDFYQYSVALYKKNQSVAMHLDYFHELPKLPQSQCDISHITLLLHSPVHKIIAIHGASGSGKTILALNYAYSKQSFYSLIFFIPSQSSRLINKKFIQLSKRLKLIIQDSLEDTISSVLRYLDKETKPFLLIFDDVSNIKDIEKYLPTSGHIVITSKNDCWQLRYEIFPLEESMIKIYLGDFYSIKIKDLLQGNYMAIGLVVKLLKNQEIDIDNLLIKLQEKENNEGLNKVFSIIIELINDKIQGAKDYLFCLGMIENSLVPRDLSVEIFKLLRVSVYHYDLIVAILNKYGLVEESKGFTIILHTTFYHFLLSHAERPIYYISILKQAFFALYPELKMLENSKKETKLSFLINKFTDYLSNDLGIDTCAVLFLKGKYELQVESNIFQAIQSFEQSLLCLKSTNNCINQIRFALGCCYLKTCRANEAQALFIQVIDSEIDYSYKIISNAFLVRAYAYIGNSVKIAEIIIHTTNTNFQQLTLPEAVYCTIHGICRLALKYDDLQELLMPYSSFLYSRAPSISLILTLLMLSQTFALKEK